MCVVGWGAGGGRSFVPPSPHRVGEVHLGKAHFGKIPTAYPSSAA